MAGLKSILQEDIYQKEMMIWLKFDFFTYSGGGKEGGGGGGKVPSIYIVLSIVKYNG